MCAFSYHAYGRYGEATNDEALIMRILHLRSLYGTTFVQVSELTDACEALTLDKEQLALEKEEMQVRVVVESMRTLGYTILFSVSARNWLQLVAALRRARSNECVLVFIHTHFSMAGCRSNLSSR